MPRPGPRPYDCVRKSWHSNKHQPIRGSLIQEIFRVVSENHCPATKKNKEWQEKLPVVVLRAEAILYSKADSEAEYMDSKTLWDRINDAINTIIRRDESTETGKFLQPCIEAALTLGCTPGRASRSERKSNPTSYLSSSSQKPSTMSACFMENARGEHTNCSPYMSYFANLSKPSSSPPGLMGQTLVSSNGNCSNDKFFTASESVAPSASTQHISTQNCPASKLVSVFPLYYGNSHREEHRRYSEIAPKSISQAADFTRMGKITSLYDSDVNSWDNIHRAGTRYASGSLRRSRCDLALRLGPPSDSCLSFENSHHARLKEDVPASSCQVGVKFGDQSRYFFPWRNANDPLNPRSGIHAFGDKKVVLEAASHKPNGALSQPCGGEPFCEEPKLLF